MIKLNKYKKYFIYVSSIEESEKLQNLLFSIGFSWGYGQTGIRYVDAPFISVNYNGDKLIGYTRNYEWILYKINNKEAYYLEAKTLLSEDNN